MKVTDAVVLQAFVVTVSRMETVLPSALRQSVQHIGAEVSSQINRAIQEIRELVAHNDCIKDRYALAHRQLQPSSGADAEMPEPLEQALEGAAAEILTATDVKAKAGEMAKRLAHHLEFGPFVAALEEAVAGMDHQAIAILHALAKRPLPPEALAETVQLPLDYLMEILQHLHQRGYIERASAGVLQVIFPQFVAGTTKAISPQTYLTITAQGRLALHRIVSPKPRTSSQLGYRYP
jgi:hypothetical protein